MYPLSFENPSTSGKISSIRSELGDKVKTVKLFDFSLFWCKGKVCKVWVYANTTSFVFSFKQEYNSYPNNGIKKRGEELQRLIWRNEELYPSPFLVRGFLNSLSWQINKIDIASVSLEAKLERKGSKMGSKIMLGCKDLSKQSSPPWFRVQSRLFAEQVVKKFLWEFSFFYESPTSS